jgi:hypothetical protein
MQLRFERTSFNSMTRYVTFKRQLYLYFEHNQHRHVDVNSALRHPLQLLY